MQSKFTRHYVTLCSMDFLAQAMTLHASLERHSSEGFVLHVLPLDSESAERLKGLASNTLRPIHDFHDSHPGMREARLNRTFQEYAWTCASNLCEFLLLRGLSEITYLDADILFFADPRIVFDEIGACSIGIIPHRLAEIDKPRLEKNGRYNVSWVTLRGPVGIECVQLWARQCREWCYYRHEPGRFGDQAYLDEWPHLWGKDLCEIENIGAGAAPWNLQQYDIALRNGRVFLNQTPLCFYHMHEFRKRSDGTYLLTNWPLRQIDKELIYGPYLNELRRADDIIQRRMLSSV